nr:hypothetical protein [uncultured Carboxylicivirga sp.]
MAKQTVTKNKEDLNAVNWENLQRLISGKMMKQFLLNWLESVALGELSDGTTIEEAITLLRQQIGNGSGSNTFDTAWFKVENGFVSLAHKYLALSARDGLETDDLDVSGDAGVTVTRVNGVTVCSFNADNNRVDVGVWHQTALLDVLIPAGNRYRITFEAKAEGMEAIPMIGYGVGFYNGATGALSYDTVNEVLHGQYGHYTIESDFNPGFDATRLKLFLRREGATGEYIFPSGSSISIQNITVEYWATDANTGGLRLPVGNLLLTTAGATPSMPPEGALPGDENFNLSTHIIPGQLAINIVDEKLFYNNGTLIKEFQAGSGNANDKGWFPTEAALLVAYPAGQDGWFAIVGETDTFWTWDTDTTAWVNTGSSMTPINVDVALSEVSTNPVQNQAVTSRLNNAPFFLAQYDRLNTSNPSTGKWVLDDQLNPNLSTQLQIHVNEYSNTADNTEWLNKLKKGSVITIRNRIKRAQYITVTLISDVSIASSRATLSINVNAYSEIDDGAVCGFMFLNPSEIKSSLITAFTGAMDFDKKEKYFNRFTQSGALNLTLSGISYGDGATIKGPILSDGSPINKTDDFIDYSGLFLGNTYTPNNGDLIDLYALVLANESKVRLQVINLGGGSITLLLITGFSSSGLNTYVDITFSEGVYGANDGITPVALADLSIFAFNPDGATAISISNITNTSGGALVGGETIIRCILSITGTPSGTESFEIRPTDADLIFNVDGNAMLATQTTGSITLIDESTSVSITNYGIAADNSYVDIYFSRGVWGDNTQSNPIAASDLIISNLVSGGVTAVSISALTTQLGGALVGGETVIRAYLSLTGTSTNTEIFEIQPADSTSIYDSSANALLSTATTGIIPLFKQGITSDLTFQPANLLNLTQASTVYTGSSSTAWNNRGLADESLNGSGYIENDIIDAASDISMLGFNTSNSNDAYSSIEEKIFQNSINIYYSSLGTNNAATFVPIDGSKMRLTRNTDKTIALFSTDGGSTFRLVKVSDRTDTSTYYIQILARYTGETNTNPKIMQ